MGFFFSCWVSTGLLGTGGAVDRHTVGCDVINQGGDGLVVVLVVEAGCKMVGHKSHSREDR